MKTRLCHRRSRGGFALVVVLLVLLALLVLTAPFLAGARNADRASTQLADRAEARVGLDSAARHARQFLADTYPSADLDKTPYFDDLEEIAVSNRFPPGFLDANDPRGAMWDVELSDVAGKIDLNSAGPLTIANLMGVTARFTQVVAAEGKELPLSSTSRFHDGSFLWSDGELIQAKQLLDGTVKEFVRGVLGPPPKIEWRGGPRPPSAHPVGAAVIDQVALAPVLWRLATPGPEQRSFEALEELARCGDQVLEMQMSGVKTAPELPPDLVRPLLESGTVHAGPRGGPVWQRAARLTEHVEGGKEGRITVDNARWLNVGSTVRIRDGQTTELAMVQNLMGGNRVALDRILKNEYAANGAVVDVLARRPVNLNTATREVLVALFSNLQLAGVNSRITRDEALALADLVIESRPLTGFEDFLRRIVLPAAGIEKLPGDAPVRPAVLAKGEGFLDAKDAVALYKNGLNSNDSSLAFSTMPYSFTTRDTYAYELRSTVNAESGVERFSVVRDEVVSIAPQKELVRLWARQEDFDEELRLTCDAPWWTTGPNSTTRWDNGTLPPSRMWAHLGTFEGETFFPGVTDTAKYQDRESPPTPEHVFASREDQGFIQLMTTREPDQSDRRKGRVLHFDHETRDLEGRYLPDQIVSRLADDDETRWVPKNPSADDRAFLRPLAFSMWLKPRTVGEAKYFDLGGPDTEVDRVSLQIEGADLVLRVVDGFGDHRDTPNRDVGELRYALSGANTPGLPAETWTHVEFDVRGNRPSQMHMLVNGLTHGVRTPGLTRLSGALGQTQTSIPVESTEGFPATCVVRIGNELIEVKNAGSGMLDATRDETGRLAGFGGRLARERMNTLSDTAAMVPEGLAATTVSHASGAPVELYGYSMRTLSSVPTGKAQLAGELGPFRAAIVRTVEAPTGGALGEAVTFGVFGITVGTGMRGVNSGVTGLVLASADDGLDTQNVTPANEYMPAFQRDGGYAVIIQRVFNAPVGNGLAVDTDGAVIGGIEIVRYTGWSDRTLRIAQTDRAIDQSQLPDLANLPAQLNQVFAGKHSFVVVWNPSITVNGVPATRDLENYVYVIPISLGVPGSGQVNGFLQANVGNSQFAQLTHLDDAENTEWVRYDYFDAQRTQVVRDDPAALLALWNVLVRGTPPSLPATPPGGGGGGGPGSGGGGPFAPEDKAAKALEPAVAAPAPQSTSSAWNPRIGKNENTVEKWPISRAVETTFQFRGVMGTYSHRHQNGTTILPVFRGPAAGFDAGRPGRMDAVFVTSSDATSSGWPLRVHRAYVASKDYEVLGWAKPAAPAVRPVTSTPVDSSGAVVKGVTDTYLMNYSWIALQDRCPEPITPGETNGNPDQPTFDSRRLSRMVCFPSGERPRFVTKAAIGGGVNGASGAIPAAVVDEIVFGDAQFARATPNVRPEETAGAALIVTNAADQDATTLRLAPSTIRNALSNLNADHKFLDEMPSDGGLLRVGDEVLAYKQLHADTGDVDVATSGRGLLGSKPQAHEPGEPVMFLEHRVVSTLAEPLSVSDARIRLAAIDDFPANGTVLIGDELISYTRIRDGALEMPRASSAPGKMDQKGDGLFRGRFGSTPAQHQSGEAVILFPTRYPDLWQERADAPELSYFGIALAQPAAYFGSFFFSKVDTSSARIGVLQKSSDDAPWDADTESDPRVKVFFAGEGEGAALRIDKQSDLMRWRVFVDYMPGAFDVKTGKPHGWKETPRLKLFSAFYHAPTTVLSSVER